jgi:HlyD family secretion protein
MDKVINIDIPALAVKDAEVRISYLNPLGDFATWKATKTSGEFDMKTFEVHAIPVEPIEDLRPGMTVLVNWDDIK